MLQLNVANDDLDCWNFCAARCAAAFKMANKSDFSNPNEDAPGFEELPAYEDAVGTVNTSTSPQTTPSDSKNNTFNILQNNRRSREQKIQIYVDEHLLPFIRAQISGDLDCQGFLYLAMRPEVPSRLDSAEEIISGIPDSISYKICKLSSDDHSTDFLRQVSVISEVEVLLKARLAAQGNRIHYINSKGRPEIPEVALSKASRSFFSRTRWAASSSAKSSPPPRQLLQPMKLGWRNAYEDQKKPRLASDEISVDVEIKDVFMRRENEMGLKETTCTPAVWVEIGLPR